MRHEIHRGNTRKGVYMRSYPKPFKARNEKHLKYVESQPCCICYDPRTVAHHLKYGIPNGEGPGFGTKSGDQWTVPLCCAYGGKPLREKPCHQQVDNGEETFFKLHRFDPHKEAMRLWRESQEGLSV